MEFGIAQSGLELCIVVMKTGLIWNSLSLNNSRFPWIILAVLQKCCSYAKILRTCFNRSINAACSGLLMQGGFIPRFCCNKYIGCLSHFLNFKGHKAGFFLINIMGSWSEFKSLTCMNRSFFVGSVIHALDYWGGYVFVFPPLMCYGPSYQLFVVSKISSILHNKLLKVCGFE